MAINSIVQGEGETATPELISVLAAQQGLSEIKGLSLNLPDCQLGTEERPLLTNLVHVPFPRRDLTAQYRQRYFLGTRRPLITVETSRGCSFRCNFCSVWC